LQDVLLFRFVAAATSEKGLSAMPISKSKIAAIELIEQIRNRPDIHLFTGPYVDGIEVTQAIQYYKSSEHLTDPKDRGADNRAGLVAKKPAYVRVYLRSGLFSALANVTGELRIERRKDPFGLNWETVATLSPQWPGQITARNDLDYATERSTLGATLNFIIPAADMIGSLRLTARIWKLESPGNVDEEAVLVNVNLLQTLQLRGVLVSYNGDDGTGKKNISLTAPTQANLQTTAAWTLTVDPLQTTANFAVGGTVAWTTPLTGVADVPGGCSTAWYNLNKAIAGAKTLDGNRSDWIYCGLLPAGIPIANVGGCATSGVSSVPNGQQTTMAHEIGHVAGLSHAPCGTTSGDPNYPAYEPYDAEPLDVPAPLGASGTIKADRRKASIGEYGLNVNSGTIYSPATSDDYMSYCNQTWISLYHHEMLLDNPKFNPKGVGDTGLHVPDLVDPWLWPPEYIPDPPAWEIGKINWRQLKAVPVISVIGMVTSERTIEVSDVMRVTAEPRVEAGIETEFTVEMLDHQQKVIARAPLMRLPSAGSGCGCCGGGSGQPYRGAYIFQALMADVEDGAALRITRPGKEEDEEPREVWSRRAPKNPPRITHFEVHPRETAGYARWEIADACGESLKMTLQFSKDGGRSWNGLASGLTDHEHRFDLAHLPSGDVIFALMAHDGFHSARCVSDTVHLPPRAPVVAIMHPHHRDTLRAGQPLHLWASVSTGTARPIEERACRWLLDGHEVGHGVEAWITTPDEGEHRCTVIAEDEGQRGEATVSFMVKGGRPREAHDETCHSSS
jgi:hypothetical protein